MQNAPAPVQDRSDRPPVQPDPPAQPANHSNPTVSFAPHVAHIKSAIQAEKQDITKEKEVLEGEQEEEDLEGELSQDKSLAKLKTRKTLKFKPKYSFRRDVVRGLQIRFVVLMESLLWCLLLLPFAAAVGIVCGLFLWALEWCTLARFHYPWIVYLCPVGGVIVAGSYHVFAGASSKGNNLVIDAVRKVSLRAPSPARPVVPFRV